MLPISGENTEKKIKDRKTKGKPEGSGTGRTSVRRALKAGTAAVLAAAMVAMDLPTSFMQGSPAVVQAAESTNQYAGWTELGSAAGRTLYGGTYKVTQDTTIRAGANQSGLTISGTVRIYVASGVTLTVVGGNASGSTGAGAGINLPSGSSLMLYGAGTLKATGGNAAGGSSGGQNGANAIVNTNARDGNGQRWSGSGGNGGAGGGGAGAGIGGIGGNGGSGGSGAGQATAACETGARANGNNGGNGYQGATGGSMGNLYVYDSVTVTATGGNASTSGGGAGSKGYGTVGCNQSSYCATDAGSGYSYSYQACAGGTGGGGGAGGAAAAIGGGAGGGGGGAGGGSGACSGAYSSKKDGNNNLTADKGCGGGGAGGNGVVGGSSGAGTANTYEKATGGSGGSGGAAGNGGSGGTVYKATTASVNTVAGASGVSAGGGSVLNGMSAVTVLARGGTNASGGQKVNGEFGTVNDAAFGSGEQQTIYAINGYNIGTITDLPTRTGYTLTGFYDSPNEGTQLADATGTPITSSAWTSGEKVYAQWTPKTYTLTLNMEGLTSVTITDNTANTIQTFTQTGSVYTMTYDHEYTLTCVPEKDSDGMDKAFIAWYGTPNSYNSASQTYTFMCPSENITVSGIAMTGVWAEDKLNFNYDTFIPETTYTTVTIQTNLDDVSADMGVVTLVAAAAEKSDAATGGSSTEKTDENSGEGASGTANGGAGDDTTKVTQYTLVSGSKPGVYTYTRARDTAERPTVYKVYVNGEDTGKTIDFSNELGTTNLTIDYYTAKITLRVDGEAGDLGTVKLVQVNTDGSAIEKGKELTLDYVKTSEGGYYYYEQQKDEQTTPTTYKAVLNGTDCPNAAQEVNLIKFSQTNVRYFDYYSAKVTTRLDDAVTYLGEIELKDASGKTTIAMTGNTGNYSYIPYDQTIDSSTVFDVYLKGEDTGADLLFDGTHNAVTLDYYNVSFDGNSNTAGTAPASEVVAGKEEIILPSSGTLSKAGSFFGGWTLKSDAQAADSSMVYQIGEKVTVTKRLSYQAKWVAEADCEARWQFPGEDTWSYGSLAEAIQKLTTEDRAMTVEVQNNAAIVAGNSFTIDANKKFIVKEGVALTVADGVTITNKGTITDNGSIYGKGATLINSGTVEGSVSGDAESRTYSLLAISTIENEAGSETETTEGLISNIKLGTDGVDGIESTIKGGQITGEIYLADGSTFSGTEVKDPEATQLSLMGGTTISSTPTDEQLSKNLGGMIRTKAEDAGTLELPCSVTFRSEVTFSGISLDTGDYEVTGLSTPVLEIAAATSETRETTTSAETGEEENTADYIVGDSTGGTVQMVYKDYNSGEVNADRRAISSGTKVTLTAKANTGYHFVGWYGSLRCDNEDSNRVIGGDGEALGTSETLELTASTNQTVYALFAVDIVTVEVRADDGIDLTVTRGDDEEATMIPAGESKIFELRYGYGLTMSYALSEITDGSTEMDETGAADTEYRFNGWYERKLTDGDGMGQETPVKEADDILQQELTIASITTDKTYIATSVRKGFIHYNLNGGVIKVDADDESTWYQDKMDVAIEKAGTTAITGYGPEKDGWEFLYWIDTDGDKYNFSASGDIKDTITITKSQLSTGITLTAVYQKNSESIFWVNGHGYASLGAVLAATNTENSPIYGEKTITYDDSQMSEEKRSELKAAGTYRTIFGSLPDGYTLKSTQKEEDGSAIVLTIPAGYSMSVGDETKSNDNNSSDKSWATGAKVEGISLQCAGASGGQAGGALSIDGQHSTISEPIRIEQGNAIHFVSDPNTGNYFSVTLLDGNKEVDTTGAWAGKTFATSDATDGDAGSSDASKDETFNLLAGRVKVTNYSGSTRQYIAECDVTTMDTASNSGYSLVAQKASELKSIRIPFEDTSLEYYDRSFVVEASTIQKGIDDASRGNTGRSGEAAENHIYVVKDSDEALTIVGDNPADPYSNLVSYGSKDKTYNNVVRLIPAIYTTSGTSVSVSTSADVQYTLSGPVRVANVSASGYQASTIWELDNLKVTGEVTLDKGSSIRMLSSKKWEDDEVITLSPVDCADGDVLVDANGTGDISSHFKLSDAAIAQGFGLYYDKANETICVENLLGIYATDETVKDKADGTIRIDGKSKSDKRILEYVSKEAYDADSSAAWTKFVDDVAENLAAGDYYVRYAATKDRSVGTVSKVYTVGAGAELEVLFREQSSMSESDGTSTLTETKETTAYNGSVTVPKAQKTITGYTFKGWKLEKAAIAAGSGTAGTSQGTTGTTSAGNADTGSTGSAGSTADAGIDEALIAPGTELTKVTENRVYSAVYEKSTYTVTLPTSNAMYQIFLADGTEVTEDNNKVTVGYGEGVTFRYQLRENASETDDFKVSVNVKNDDGSVSRKDVALNADGSYTIPQVTGDTSVTITGTTTQSAPDSGKLGTESAAGDDSADGKITGVTDEMEYISKEDYEEGKDWTSVPSGGTTIEGLEPGSYYVRYKSKGDGTGSSDENSPASDYTVVVVGSKVEGSAVKDLSILAPTFVEYLVGYDRPAAKPIILTAVGGSDVTVTKVELKDADGAENKAADAFELSGPKLTEEGITISKSDYDQSWTIQPKAKLEAGEYKAAVEVTFIQKEAGTSDGEETEAVKETKAAVITFKVAEETSEDEQPEVPAFPGTTESDGCKLTVKDDSEGSENSKIIDGLDANTKYQYSTDGGSTWTDVDDGKTSITIDITDGSKDVLIRVKEETKEGTDGTETTTPASDPVKVHVGSESEESATRSLSIAAPTFTSRTEGYSQPAAKPLTLTAVGGADVTVTKVAFKTSGSTEGDGEGSDGETSSDFTLSGPDGNTTVSKSSYNTSYKVQPKADLKEGTHTATVVVTYITGSEEGEDPQTATTEVTITFTVKAAEEEPEQETESKSPSFAEGGLSVTDGNDGNSTIGGLDPERHYEYSTDGGNTWTKVPDGSTTIDITDGPKTVLIREQASETKGDDSGDSEDPDKEDTGTKIPASDPVQVYVPATASQKLVVSAANFGTLSYTDGEYTASSLPLVMAADSNRDVTVIGVDLDEDAMNYFELASGDTDGDITITKGTENRSYTLKVKKGLTPGSYSGQVKVTYGNDKTATAEITATIVKASKAAPENLEVKNESVLGASDGEIILPKDGQTYEYSTDGVHYVTLTEDTKLPYGEYYVRTKETERYESSAPTLVQIGSGELPTYALKVSALRLSDATVGYTQAPSGEITITVTGNAGVTVSRIILMNNRFFTLSLNDAAWTTGNDGAKTLTIAAKGVDTGSQATAMSGLGIGTYTDKVLVYYNNGKVEMGTITFVVRNVSSSSGNSGSNGGGYTEEGSAGEDTTTAVTTTKPTKTTTADASAAGTMEGTTENAGQNTDEAASGDSKTNLYSGSIADIMANGVSEDADEAEQGQNVEQSNAMQQAAENGDLEDMDETQEVQNKTSVLESLAETIRSMLVRDSLSIVNLLLLLGSALLAIYHTMKRDQKYGVPIGVVVILAVVFILTTGTQKIVLVNLYTILFAIGFVVNLMFNRKPEQEEEQQGEDR